MAAPRSPWLVPSLILAFLALVLGGALLFGGTDEPAAASLEFGDVTAEQGMSGESHVVTVNVPYSFVGDERARYLFTLTVASDEGFEDELGSEAADVAVSGTHPDGETFLVVPVPGPGTYHWRLVAEPHEGTTAAAPGPMTGTVDVVEAPK